MNKEFNPYQFPPTDPAPKSRIESEIVHIEQQESEESPFLEEGEARPDDEQTREEEAEEAKREAKRIAREKSAFWQFISGNFLILEGATGTYRYLLIVAATLFLSVVSIFYTFHLSKRYTARESEVQLLHERKLEYQRVRFNKTSHSAIVKELKRRGIPIYDLQESKTIIDK
ncbi:MAG: hypothetical protein SNI45_02880 [Rikenellaceae bacterium]